MLSETQQGYALEAMRLVSPCLSYFLDNYPCLRGVLTPEDMESAAMFACATAATTYDPSRAGISAYFSRAILHELLKACRREIRSGSKSIYRISLRAAECRMTVRLEREDGDADLITSIAQAFSSLSEEDQRWVKAHAIDSMSIRKLAKQENLTTRQAAKLVRAKMAKLRKSVPVQRESVPDRGG